MQKNHYKKKKSKSGIGLVLIPLLEAATEIYNQGVCLEEYLGKVN